MFLAPTSENEIRHSAVWERLIFHSYVFALL